MPEEVVSLKFEATNAERFNKLVKEAEVALRRQARALDEQARALDKEVSALKAAEVQDRSKIQSLQRQSQELKINVKETRARISAMREEAAAAKLAAQNTTVLSTAVKGLGASIQTALLPLLGITAAVGALGKALTSFGQFERTLNTIQAVSGATADELKRIEESSIKLGATTIFTNQQVAESYENLAKAGFTAQEGLTAMPGLLDLAAAAGGELGNASEITAGALRGFNLEVSKSTHVADLLAQSANKSSADVTDMGFAIKQVAPVAVTANQSIEEMTATLSILANRMIKGADAGTDLRALLVRLIDPPKEAANALNALGVKIKDANGNIRPFLEVIKELQTQLGKFDKATQNKFLADIAGLENVKSLAALVNTAGVELDDMRASMENVDGAAKKMADTINKGLNTAWQEFIGSVETLFLKIGQDLSPAIIEMVNQMKQLIVVITENSTVITALLDLVLEIFNVLLKLLLALSDFVKTVDSVTKVSVILEGALKALTAALRVLELLISTLTNGIGGLVEAGERLLRLDFSGAWSSLSNRLRVIQNEAGQTVAALGKLAEVSQKRFNGPLLLGEIQAVKPVEGEGLHAFLSRLNSENAANLAKARAKSQNPKKPPPLPTGTNSLNSASGRPKKNQNEKTPEQIDTEEISRIAKGFSEFQQDLRGEFDLGEARLGPFPVPTTKVKMRLQELSKELKGITQAEKELKDTQLKTTEGIKKREQALTDLRQEAKKNEAETQKAINELDRLTIQLRETQQEFIEGFKAESTAGELDILRSRIEEIRDTYAEAFEQNQISAEEYYGKLLELSQDYTDAELFNIDQQIQAVKLRIATIEDEEGRVEDLLALRQKLLDLELQRNKLAESGRKESDTIKKDLDKELRRSSDRLKDRTEQAISEGIQDALTGQGIGNAFKKFAKALRDAVVQELANALAKRFTGIFQPFFDAIGGLSNRISGVSETGAASSSGHSLFGTLGLLGGRGRSGVSNRGKSSGSGSKGAALAGAAIIGGSLISGINSRFAKVAGKALTGLGLGATIGSAFGGQVGAGIGAAIGAVGGGILGLFGRDNSKKVQGRVDSILGGIDTSALNLNDLFSRSRQISRIKAKGKNARSIRTAAFAEVVRLIRERERQIKETVDTLGEENLQLGQEIQLAETAPFKQSVLQRQFELEKLQRDTKKALDLFKDSQEAQTKILENETLKRKLIDEDLKSEFRDTAQTLEDLLKQRDEIENSDVFQRAKTRSQGKADQLKGLDKQIAEALLSLNELKKSGVPLPALAGINALIGAAGKAGNFETQLNITINGAQDPNTVAEEVRRQIETFFRKNLGVSAA